MTNFEQNIHYDTDQTLADGGGLFQSQPDAEQYTITREDVEKIRMIRDNPERLELLKNKDIIKAWLGQLCAWLARDEANAYPDEKKINNYRSAIKCLAEVYKGADPIETMMKDRRSMAYVTDFCNKYSAKDFITDDIFEKQSKLGARGNIQDGIDRSFEYEINSENQPQGGYSEEELRQRAEEMRAEEESTKPKAFEYIKEIEKELGEDLG